jgi:serine/threonine protein kinase
VVGLLGEGAQAATLDAIDKREGRPVAIKEFRVRGARSWKDVELAEREARVLATLSHPNLPVYIDHFEQDGALFLVTERIEGEPLNRARKRGELFDEAAVRRFLTDAASALDYLHGKSPPIVHRDIKPGNVIRRPDGSFAFVDFGSVRDSLKPEGGSTVVGTFGYMAPEQFQGRAGPGSDVYAVGATALSLLTGREPEELPHRGLGIEVHQALSARSGHLDPALPRILAAMLEPNPDRRPTRIRPLIAQLRGTSQGAWEPRGDRTAPHRRTERRDKGRLEHELREEAQRQAQNLRDRSAEWHAWEDEWKRWGEQWKADWKQSPDWRRQRAKWRRHPQNPVFLLLMSLGLMVARTGNWAVFRVLLPVVLTMLSVVFGRELRVAARRMREIGRTNERSLRYAGERLRDLSRSEEPDARARVRVERETTAPDSVRDTDGVEVDDTDELDADEGRRKRRGQA